MRIVSPDTNGSGRVFAKLFCSCPNGPQICLPAPSKIVSLAFCGSQNGLSNTSTVVAPFATISLCQSISPVLNVCHWPLPTLARLLCASDRRIGTPYRNGPAFLSTALSSTLSLARSKAGSSTRAVSGSAACALTLKNKARNSLFMAAQKKNCFLSI